MAHCIKILLIFLLFRQGTSEYQIEQVLHKHLLKGYSKDVRPDGAVHHFPLHVDFSIVMTQLGEMDVKKQTMTINSFMNLKWKDHQMSWKLQKFPNITRIKMGSTLIWTPDIVLYNNAQEIPFFHTEIYKTKTTVHHNGMVSWNSPVTWKVTCPSDVTWFPMDQQVCTMQFGSWTYGRRELILVFDEHKMSQKHFLNGNSKVGNGEWEVLKVEMNAVNVTFKCCDDPFSLITYTVHLKRLSLYYFIYILLPLFCLVLLFHLIFHINSEERTSFGVTILLSVSVYLLVISEKLPEKSDAHPMLGLCFIVEFYVLCIALVVAAIIGKLKGNHKKPSQVLVKLLDNLGAFKSWKKDDSRKVVDKVATTENGQSNYQSEALLSKSNVYGKSNEEVWHKISDFLDSVAFCASFAMSLFLPVLIATVI